MNRTSRVTAAAALAAVAIAFLPGCGDESDERGRPMSPATTVNEPGPVIEEQEPAEPGERPPSPPP